MSVQEEIDNGVQKVLFLDMKIDEIEKLQKRIIKAKKEGKDPTTLREELVELKVKANTYLKAIRIK